MRHAATQLRIRAPLMCDSTQSRCWRFSACFAGTWSALQTTPSTRATTSLGRASADVTSCAWRRSGRRSLGETRPSTVHFTPRCTDSPLVGFFKLVSAVTVRPSRLSLPRDWHSRVHWRGSQTRPPLPGHIPGPRQTVTRSAQAPTPESESLSRAGPGPTQARAGPRPSLARRTGTRVTVPGSSLFPGGRDALY